MKTKTKPKQPKAPLITPLPPMTRLESAAELFCFKLADKAERGADLTFWMPAHELASHLGVGTPQAWAIINSLIKRGILSILEKGEAWQEGKAPKATVYQFMPPEPAGPPGPEHTHILLLSSGAVATTKIRAPALGGSFRFDVHWSRPAATTEDVREVRLWKEHRVLPVTEELAGRELILKDL